MSEKTETIAVDGGEMAIYVARPSRPNGGAVVALQEIFGVNANIRGIADDLAAKGYLAVAPDLFWRQRPGVDLDPADPAAFLGGRIAR